MTPANFIIQRELTKFSRQLSSWEASVLQSRDLATKVRLAWQKPTPGTVIRSLRTLYSPSQQQAERRVEAHLTEALKDVTPDHKDFQIIIRGLQGSWPKLYLEIRRRPPQSEAAPSSTPKP